MKVLAIILALSFSLSVFAGVGEDSICNDSVNQSSTQEVDNNLALGQVEIPVVGAESN